MRESYLGVCVLLPELFGPLYLVEMDDAVNEPGFFHSEAMRNSLLHANEVSIWFFIIYSVLYSSGCVDKASFASIV